MANGPEPKDQDSRNNASFSVEDQIKAFTAKLDGPVKVKEGKLLPGFLFRDGEDCILPLLVTEGDFIYNWTEQAKDITRMNATIASIDENLLRQQQREYQNALKARDLLKGRIKLEEILGMVRDVWGKGELFETSTGYMLAYFYPRVFEQTETYTSETCVGQTNMNIGTWKTSTHTSKTGEWGAQEEYVTEEVGINFGNAKHCRPPHRYVRYNRDSSGHVLGYSVDRDDSYHTADPLNVKELDEFFADFSADSHDSSFIRHCINSPNNHGNIEGLYFLQGIPRRIWRRADNLGVYVQVPYALLPSKDKEGLYEYVLAPAHGEGNKDFAWFDQSSTQQEIMDYLTKMLESQKALGQLPSQIEAVENAKIEELKKRGLFIGYWR